MGNFSFSPAITPGSVGIWSLCALVLIALVKSWPSLRQAQLNSDSSLRADLMARIIALETHVQSLESQITNERDRHAAELHMLRQQYDAKMQVTRHRLNNETMALDALLMLMEAAPERLASNIGMIKTLRTERARNVAVEQGAMVAAAGSLEDALAAKA